LGIPVLGEDALFEMVRSGKLIDSGKENNCQNDNSKRAAATTTTTIKKRKKKL